MASGPTFILQTTRAGRLPSNALFTDEGAALEETLKATKSGEFEQTRLLKDFDGSRSVMFDSNLDPATKKQEGGGLSLSSRAGAKTAQPSGDWVGKISFMITAAMVLGVIIFAVSRVLNQ